MCNLSISSGRFPDTWKMAKLKPLFKKGSKTDPKNYCPSFLLPLMSKMLERVVHEQSMKFLEKHNILYKFQSGFWNNHSTDFCQSYLTHKISEGFNSGLPTGVIFIDLEKAFNTINHNIFLLKMPSLRFSCEVIDWYKSYLPSRKFHVNILDKFSTSADLQCGVSQGSILGSLLYLLHINNMPQAVYCVLFLYADDTCLLFQHKDLEWIKELTKNSLRTSPIYATGLWITSWVFTLGRIKLNPSFSLPKQKKENENSGHTISWRQNQAKLHI